LTVEENQSFDRAAAARSEWFLSNPTTHTHIHSITFLGVNPGFAAVCGFSPCFDHDLFCTLLSYVIHFSSPVMSRFKKMIRFRSVLAMTRRWKFDPLNFSLLNYVAPKH